MSFVVRRSLSTLVPPKVANPQGLGAAKDAVRMARIAKFYEKLPKGAAPQPQSGGPISWYQNKYMGKNSSGAPIWHLIFSLMALGYGMEYYFHLRHHKNHPSARLFASTGAFTLIPVHFIRKSSLAFVSRHPGNQYIVTAWNIVMAESSLHDVALKTQSVGDDSPSDAPATTTDNQSIGGDVEEGNIAKENGIISPDPMLLRSDDLGLEDGGTRSDTDTSRANSVAGDGKTSDLKPVKKFVASKPISFAKYSVPKSVTANAPPKVIVDKILTPTASSTSTTPLGRPRLVAKTTISSQQKLSAYKPVTPDPMQVWNKNRATPQPSTKHLTDEELKQQYGIHMTSRLQSDNDGKEAKWADIDDDDEDDWAPETIEWNDGTKTTVTSTDHTTSKAAQDASTNLTDEGQTSTTPKPVKPQYSSTVGPNATILKIGASVERQQAQRALAQQSKGPVEKPPTLGAKVAPAPAPAKSPWAKIPEIDKISPIAINPQSSMPPPGRFPSVGSQTPISTGAASSPAKEISADDFNRSWRNSPSSQTKELFMPSSGRYEAVSDGKRRMSKNEQNFRAPAVLQRPSQRDTRAPAEPSPAFQTRRTSVDLGRRRASSSISGGSGQFARRMSFKSGETINLSQPDTTAPQIPMDELSPTFQTPTTYQARGPDYMSGAPVSATDAELEAQRAAQKALMREKIEKARQRKLEEEAKLESEKQERIRLKLASLGPPPETSKSKQEESASEKPSEDPIPTPRPSIVAAPVQSPPKPPQPLPSGEPQQYGMMKVHPIDSIRKVSSSTGQIVDSGKMIAESPSTSQPTPSNNSEISSPAINGVRPSTEISRAKSEEIIISEPSPKVGKSVSLGSDARVGWGNSRNDHRPPQAASLWGLPNNKALGNGTFDHSLAGYSPQDLSRTSSTGQAWINGRTPTLGQSPQLNHVNQHVPETRSHLLQSMTSPDSQPLNLNSEIDSALPTSRPAPIGRPPVHPNVNVPSQINGHPNHNQANLAAWNNFSAVARVQEKTETERFNREFNERREEEKRTGVRQQAPYNFNETFKQVQLGDQAGQRHISNVAQSSHVPSSVFGAVGSSPLNEAQSRLQNLQYGQLGRGSRFFPQQMHPIYPQERRAVTYGGHSEPRTPSPPPAEEYASYHPAFDGDFQHPKVHFPREKAVVRLPPAAPLAPLPREPTPPPPTEPKVPLTWAARVSMPAPAPVITPVRAVSTPLVNNPSWQERFNGLLFPKQASVPSMAPAPASASTREPLDIVPAISAASVSLPTPQRDPVDSQDSQDSGKSTSKDVEDEEDLFEDREAGSLPTIHLPRDTALSLYPPTALPRILPAPVDPNSIHMFMVSNWSERYGFAKPQYAVVKAPGSSGKGIKRDLPVRNGSGTTQTRARTSYPTKNYLRPKSGPKPRVPSKVH